MNITDVNFAIEVLSHPQSGDESDIDMALKIAIELLKNSRESLEQEPILDKIRAEIVDLGQRTMNDNRASGIWACRDIIDKYRTESEGI